MKSEAFKYKSADKKTMIDAVRWLPDNGEYKAVLQITHRIQRALYAICRVYDREWFYGGST